MDAISFRGGESTGSVADRKPETARQETTGGVGARRNQDSIFVDNELKQDTVCFRASAYETKKSASPLEVLLGVTAGTALTIGLLGLAHKYDLVGRISNKKAQEFFRSTDSVTEPCHKACSWVKRNSYDKIAAWFHKK